MAFELKPSDVAIVVSTLLGPILAVQAQMWLERRRQANARRVDLFRTLMATRAAVVSPEHVKALNMIDVEFYQRRRWLVLDNEPFQRVRTAWKAYFDQLSKVYPSDPNQIPVFEQTKWELFYDLLHEMALASGFNQFDKTYIKNNCYRPIAHGNTEKQQLAVLNGLADVLSGHKALPLEVRSIPAIPGLSVAAGTGAPAAQP
jgi:hypothetical protein